MEEENLIEEGEEVGSSPLPIAPNNVVDEVIKANEPIKKGYKHPFDRAITGKRCRYCGVAIDPQNKNMACRKCYFEHHSEIHPKGSRKRHSKQRMDLSVKKVTTHDKCQLPPQVRMNYGCLYCEWRGTSWCPFGFKKGAGMRLSENMHKDGICLERTDYLLSLSPVMERNKQLTFAAWQMHFNKQIMQVNQLKSFMAYQASEEKINKMKENEESPKEIEKTKMESAVLRAQWMEEIKEVMKYDDKQVDRETIKKLDIKQSTTLSLTDIHRIMRPDIVVDAEIKEDSDDKDSA